METIYLSDGNWIGGTLHNNGKRCAVGHICLVEGESRSGYKPTRNKDIYSSIWKDNYRDVDSLISLNDNLYACYGHGRISLEEICIILTKKCKDINYPFEFKSTPIYFPENLEVKEKEMVTI